LLEELVATELEGALEEVAGESWAYSGQEGAGALVLDDLAESADHAAVVGCWVELDAGLDAVKVLVSMTMRKSRGKTYTSTGVRPPWVTEQHTAPAKAKRE
jgi:hypothetical protein